MNLNTASPKMKKSGGRGGPTRQKPKTPQSLGPPQGQVFEGLYQNDRFVNSATSLLGCTARVSGKSGKQFEGIFKTVSPEGSIVLGKANPVSEQHQNGVVGPAIQRNMYEQLVMNKKDWVMVEFRDVDLEECYQKRDTFKTDNAIAKRMNGQPQKELEKWVSTEDGDGASEAPTLETSYPMSNGWSAEEMFKMNEKRYGVKSTYDENMEEYTTKLEKSDTPEYREKEKIAAQKAEEIINESAHERGMLDSGRSEEELYSSVVRKVHDRTNSLNWRERPDRDQRQQKQQREGSGSPALARKEPTQPSQPVKSNQSDEAPEIQVKEKVVKPVTEAPVESKPEKKVEVPSGIPKEPKPSQNVSPVKPQFPVTKPPVNQTTPKTIPAEPSPPKSPVTAANTTVTAADTIDQKGERVRELKDLKDWGTKFKLADKPKENGTKAKESGTKAKKPTKEGESVTKEKEKEKEEKTKAKEGSAEPQPEEPKPEAEPTSAETKPKSTLNPNAQEFRPVKRNSPSPRSSSTPSSGGTASPFQAQSPHNVSPYPPSGVYTRHGSRGRGPRPDYMDHTNYMTPSNAAGQPFFTQMGPFVHAPPPAANMQYIPSGNIRQHSMHPGQAVFLQTMPPGQGPVMVSMGQMGAGPYADPTIYYGAPTPVQMIQSPPQIPSPSLPQSHFNFSPPSVTLPPNAVRSVPQMQPQQSITIPRQLPNELQPTQIIAPNRPPQAPNYPGN